MSQYTRGIRYERIEGEHLIANEGYLGYQRTAGSHSWIDLIAWTDKNALLLIEQVKSSENGKLSASDKRELEEFKYVEVLAVKRFVLYHKGKRKNNRIVIWEN